MHGMCTRAEFSLPVQETVILSTVGPWPVGTGKRQSESHTGTARSVRVTFAVTAACGTQLVVHGVFPSQNADRMNPPACIHRYPSGRPTVAISISGRSSATRAGITAAGVGCGPTLAAVIPTAARVFFQAREEHELARSKSLNRARTHVPTRVYARARQQPSCRGWDLASGWRTPMPAGRGTSSAWTSTKPRSSSSGGMPHESTCGFGPI